jgi:hypothetical protein
MIRQQIYLMIFSGLSFFSLAYSAQPQSVGDEFTKQGVKQVVQVVGSQTNDLINYLKEQYGIVSPLQKAQQENMDAQVKLSQAQQELNEQQKILNDKQSILADKQIEEAALDTYLKKITIVKETCAMLPKNSKKAIDAIKRTEMQLDELIKDFPALEEETKITDEPTVENNKKIEDIKAKTSLLTLITTPCILAVTKAGECADSLAGYSFAYITNLNCLKETFVAKHAVGINRTLVAATLVMTTYAAYKLYKAKTYVDNDDDIFGDDTY